MSSGLQQSHRIRASCSCWHAFLPREFDYEGTFTFASCAVVLTAAILVLNMLGRLLPVTVLVGALLIVGLLYAGVSSSDAPSIEPIKLHVPEGDANAMSADEQQPRAEVAPAVSTPLHPTSPGGPVEGGG